MNTEVGTDSQSLAAELAAAVETESLPQMLCSLLKRAQLELQAWHEGSSIRGLAIARFAVSEWHRWRLESGRASRDRVG
jgi:hypothetical protein